MGAGVVVVVAVFEVPYQITETQVYVGTGFTTTKLFLLLPLLYYFYLYLLRRFPAYPAEWACLRRHISVAEFESHYSARSTLLVVSEDEKVIFIKYRQSKDMQECISTLNS